MFLKIATAGFCLFTVVACAPTSHILTGKARAPVSPDQVKVFLRPPAQFEEVAALDASSKSMFGTGGQKSVDKVIARLKGEAGQLGANGIIIDGFSDAQTGSIGTGVGSDSYGRSSSVGVGVGGSLGIYTKTGHATAIYIDPSAMPSSDVPAGAVPPGPIAPDSPPSNVPAPSGQPRTEPQPT